MRSSHVSSSLSNIQQTKTETQKIKEKMKTIIKTLVAVIGMMALAFNISFAQVVSSSSNLPAGCTSCTGFSTTTGTPCNINGCCDSTIAPPEKLPIGDATDLEAYLWEQVADVGMWSWASSMIHSTQNIKSDVRVPYLKTNGVIDVEEIFQIIRTQRLTLSVLYLSDTINLGSGLWDKDGRNLFYSDSSSGINPPQNGVSRNTLDVVLQMNSETWIPLSGTQWFEIIERDENGNPIRYYSSREWDVQNGKIRFPNYFAKKNGEIWVTLCDGTQIAYALKGGRKIAPTTVLIEVGNVSAIGLRTFRDTNAIYVEVSSEEYKRDINPLSQFVNTIDRWVFLSAWVNNPNTGQRDYAARVAIWPQGKTDSIAQEFEEIPSSSHILPFYLPAGKYWVKYIGFNDWPYGNQFGPPYQGGGGGSSSSTPVPVEGK